MCKYNLDLLIKRLLSSWWLHGNKLQVSCIRCPLPNYKRAQLLTAIKVILYTDFTYKKKYIWGSYSECCSNSHSVDFELGHTCRQMLICRKLLYTNTRVKFQDSNFGLYCITYMYSCSYIQPHVTGVSFIILSRRATGFHKWVKL